MNDFPLSLKGLRRRGRKFRGQSAGTKCPPAKQVALCSVAGALVHVVNRLQVGVKASSSTPDLHGPVTEGQKHEAIRQRKTQAANRTNG